MVNLHGLRLEPGETFYCGYHEWVVHPDEAGVILAQGFVRMNGRAMPAHQVGNINGYPQIRVAGLERIGMASDPQCAAADIGRMAA